MAVTTVTVRKLGVVLLSTAAIGNINTIGGVPGGRFTFTFDPGGGATHRCRGITWDGARLIFSTEGSATRAAAFIDVDPSSGSVVRFQPTTGGAVLANILDLCWNGAFFYAIVEEVTVPNNVYRIAQYSRDGQFMRNVATISANERGIDWDGAFLIVHEGLDPGTNQMNKYDPSTGTKLATFSMVGENEPRGVACNGYCWLTKFITEGDGEIENIFTQHEPGLTGTSNQLRRKANTLGIIDPITPRAPICWDGAFVWEFFDQV